ncbi:MULTISPECIES: hypothetical protein [Pseudomonas]|nr:MULTISPECIES: hypothetical protein [Pseudomonas]
MSIPIELVGGDEWLEAFARQQRAFKEWRSYLHCKAKHSVYDIARKIA